VTQPAMPTEQRRRLDEERCPVRTRQQPARGCHEDSIRRRERRTRRL